MNCEKLNKQYNHKFGTCVRNSLAKDTPGTFDVGTIGIFLVPVKLITLPSWPKHKVIKKILSPQVSNENKYFKRQPPFNSREASKVDLIS